MSPSAFLVLQLRAEARATLYSAGEYGSVEEAVEPLFTYARAVGLIEQIGLDIVRDVIMAPFALEG